MSRITGSDIESYALEGPEDQGFQCCYGTALAHDGDTETETFLVVLEDWGDHMLPRTACLVEYSNRQRKLIAEYEACIKAEAAQHS